MLAQAQEAQKRRASELAALRRELANGELAVRECMARAGPDADATERANALDGLAALQTRQTERRLRIDLLVLAAEHDQPVQDRMADAGSARAKQLGRDEAGILARFVNAYDPTRRAPAHTSPPPARPSSAHCRYCGLEHEGACEHGDVARQLAFVLIMLAGNGGGTDEDRTMARASLARLCDRQPAAGKRLQAKNVWAMAAQAAARSAQPHAPDEGSCVMDHVDGEKAWCSYCHKYASRTRHVLGLRTCQLAVACIQAAGEMMYVPADANIGTDDEDEAVCSRPPPMVIGQSPAKRPRRDSATALADALQAVTDACEYARSLLEPSPAIGVSRWDTVRLSDAYE